MKLAVLNFSGNVGKTTIARHLLAPRIPGCQFVSVESINADDGPSPTIRGRQFADLQEYLQTDVSVVVDVGASNVEDLLALMHRYQGSHEDFDGFVVPAVPVRKQQQDTAATLAELGRMGVPPDRIRLVFNQVEHGHDVERVFDTLLAFCAATDSVQPRLKACLHVNEVYPQLRNSGKSPSDLAADPTDFKALIAQASSQPEKLALARQLGMQRLARGVLPELDACFAALELDSLAPKRREPVGLAVVGGLGSPLR